MKKNPPNIVFIFADQMHGFALGCMGHPNVKTPNLDRLAKRGVLFRNAYSASPICTPARANMWTGRYPSQTGVLFNDQPIPEGETCLAHCLNDAGYRTSYVGKWHLGSSGNEAVPPEWRAGFQEFIGYQCFNDFYKDVFFFDEAGRCHSFQKHRTEATTDIALDRLRHLKEHHQPFALVVSYQNPHYPLQPAPEFERMYHGKPVRRRLNAQDIDPYTPTFSPPADRPADPAALRYGNNLDEYLRLYCAMVTQLDANVGRIVEQLRKDDLLKNTVIVFTSDHGDLQGSHGLTNKALFWEESVRIPMIASVPGGVHGVETDVLISTTDFMPTLLELAGGPVPSSAEGFSYAPFLRGEKQPVQDYVISENEQAAQWLMIRDARYKLVTTRDGLAPTQLFDLKDDPYEMNNLVTCPNAADERDRLQQLLVSRYRDLQNRTHKPEVAAGSLIGQD
jgi:arylsulfatase A-like enzyme